jgi:nucleoside-diphosphate-sugar epimerase
MRLLFLGGTGPVGIAACREAISRGYDITVAHSGQHEPPDDLTVEHIHADRGALLSSDGPIADVRADAIVDTRATAASAKALLDCSRRAGATRIVVVSSTDVYEYFVVGSGHEKAGGRAVLPAQALPITEDAPLRRAPYPWATPGHDNAAMELALAGRRQDESIAVLRPGMIYGPGAAGREWTLVSRIRAGIRKLELPDGGAQFFARVAVERVGRAVIAAIEKAPVGWWPVNVVDPYGWTYAGLAGEVARLLNWKWEPVVVPWEAAAHPFKIQSPYFCSDRRLREVLGVTEPDPTEALAATVAWLWEHGAEHYPNQFEDSEATHRGPERIRRHKK